MVGANATEVQSLAKVHAMLAKLSGAENTIIGVVSFDGDTSICCLRFQEHLASDGIAGSSSQLMMDEKKGAEMVNVNRAACVAIAGGAVP